MEGLLNAFRNLGPGRILALFVGMAALIAMASLSITQLSRPGMALLYGGLSAQEAAQMTSFLAGQNIPYEVRGEGAVYVPGDRVGELRLQAAGEGLVGGSMAGYELFDQSSAFGTTNFVQNLNAKRALEGELARTIGALPAVAGARVHLVLPKQNLFSRERTQPSAAVALNLGNRQLTPDQVGAIANLTAAAVPNLALTHVTIIDQRGSMLFNGAEQGAGTAAMARLGSQLETSLAQEVTTLLERVTGPGQVAVRIHAVLNTENIEETSEIFDPTQQVVRSEQVIESSSANTSGGGNTPVGLAGNLPGGEGAAAAGGGSSGTETRTETTTNYEITKTVRNLTQAGGQIQRLSIAVLLGGRITESEDGTRTTEPFTDEQRATIERLVKGATGFSTQRGDTLEIADLPFTPLAEPEAVAAPFITKEQIFQIAQQALLVVGLLLVALLVVKPALSVLSQAAGGAGGPSPLPTLSTPPLNVGEGGTHAAAAGGGEASEAQQAFTIKQRESAAKKAGEVVDQHPEESLGVVRAWMSGSTPQEES